LPEPHIAPGELLTALRSNSPWGNDFAVERRDAVEKKNWVTMSFLPKFVIIEGKLRKEGKLKPAFLIPSSLNRARLEPLLTRY
jgi:hypothetical protein